MNQSDANDIVQILTESEQNSDIRPLRGPTYFRVEGTDVTGVALKSSRTKNFSTEAQTEKVFENDSRSIVVVGVVGLWYRIETPSMGVAAYEAPARAQQSV